VGCKGFHVVGPGVRPVEVDVAGELSIIPRGAANRNWSANHLDVAVAEGILARQHAPEGTRGGGRQRRRATSRGEEGGVGIRVSLALGGNRGAVAHSGDAEPVGTVDEAPSKRPLHHVVGTVGDHGFH